jgi:hypothetical protein
MLKIESVFDADADLNKKNLFFKEIKKKYNFSIWTSWNGMEMELIQGKYIYNGFIKE